MASHSASNTDAAPPRRYMHSAHWGVFEASWQADKLVIKPHADDPDPNLILQNLPTALRHQARIARPMVRRGWLERGPGPDNTRGRDEFVAMPWDEVLDLLAAELRRVKDQHGPDSVFGGSYGWSSAGRFHHAQSQVHRFLNTTLGGYVRSVNSYSSGAASVIMPHIFGAFDSITRKNVTWEQIVEHTDIVIAFGGMALKNSMVASGGISRHVERGSMRHAQKRGCEFVLVSPLRSDMPEEAGATWIAPVPGTDTALILGLIHTLVTEDLHDRDFITRYCEGWDTFEAYVLGHTDGTPKTASWAAGITGVAEDEIAGLARRLAGKRSLVAVAHALQRAQHGEQPVWASVALAAALGQIGLPGGGHSYALGALAHYGKTTNAVPTGTLSQGINGVKNFIPVARISDMLLNPGARFDYDGQRMTYADIKLVYWAGGNPFHHHQDLNRLRKAFAKVETLVVHEIGWTATARHADIVLPCTMTLEREDIGSTPTDPLMVAMHQAAAPYAEARDDYTIFSALAERLGAAEAFTEGRTAREWLRHLYSRTQEGLTRMGLPAPDFDTFWQEGTLRLPSAPDDGGILRAFRDDPVGASLPTPSGRIEITSAKVAGFGYDDCPGHPAWLKPSDVPDGRHPLWLVANQPATRLHSQFDYGAHSNGAKVRGREVLRLHPNDAAARGISEGDIVRVFNTRGACLAAAAITADIRPGVAQLPTGAWYDPETPAEENPTCVHGNPNVLTRDVGTSRLAQGCTGQLTSVQVEIYEGQLPPIRAFDPPLG
jgi:biotin/methionine sulfoxide reductase